MRRRLDVRKYKHSQLPLRRLSLSDLKHYSTLMVGDVRKETRQASDLVRDRRFIILLNNHLKHDVSNFDLDTSVFGGKARRFSYRGHHY